MTKHTTDTLASQHYHKPHPLAAREQAEILYVFGESTLKDIAACIGAALSTIKRWASEHAWRSKRAAYRRGRENIYKLYADASTKALETKSADDINVAIKMHNMVEGKRLQLITNNSTGG